MQILALLFQLIPIRSVYHVQAVGKPSDWWGHSGLWNEVVEQQQMSFGELPYRTEGYIICAVENTLLKCQSNTN